MLLMPNKWQFLYNSIEFFKLNGHKKHSNEVTKSFLKKSQKAVTETHF
jgi:hypothetical protein